MPAQYVLHIAKWFPNRDDDLEGIFTKRHIDSTNPYFNSVVFYARASSLVEGNKFFIIEESTYENQWIFTAYYKRTITGFAIVDKLIKLFLYLIVMNKLLKQALKQFGKPVLLHAHVLVRAPLIAYLFSRRLRIPYVVTEHSTYFTSTAKFSLYSIKNLIRKFLIRRACAVITVSLDLEQGMKRFGLSNTNYVRVFNSVNTRVYKYMPKVSDSINILHISEFNNEHKNVLGLLNVIKRLHDTQTKFIFHLAGYGKDLKDILDFIKIHRLNDCVVYHGKLKEDQLAKLYNLADVFVLFSNKENMPCVIEEALCCGTPVISTDVGGIKEVLGESNGILINRANQEALYSELMKIVEHKVKFEPIDIADSAAQLFSFESVGIRLNEIYRKCILVPSTG
jgi:glycosyltransferase involved in cell wall biosynthesis